MIKIENAICIVPNDSKKEIEFLHMKDVCIESIDLISKFKAKYTVSEINTEKDNLMNELDLIISDVKETIKYLTHKGVEGSQMLDIVEYLEHLDSFGTELEPELGYQNVANDILSTLSAFNIADQKLLKVSSLPEYKKNLVLFLDEYFNLFQPDGTLHDGIGYGQVETSISFFIHHYNSLLEIRKMLVDFFIALLGGSIERGRYECINVIFLQYEYCMILDLMIYLVGPRMSKELYGRSQMDSETYEQKKKYFIENCTDISIYLLFYEACVNMNVSLFYNLDDIYVCILHLLVRGFKADIEQTDDYFTTNNYDMFILNNYSGSIFFKLAPSDIEDKVLKGSFYFHDCIVDFDYVRNFIKIARVGSFVFTRSLNRLSSSLLQSQN
jgi:hypothetical protein